MSTTGGLHGYSSWIQPALLPLALPSQLPGPRSRFSDASSEAQSIWTAFSSFSFFDAACQPGRGHARRRSHTVPNDVMLAPHERFDPVHGCVYESQKWSEARTRVRSHSQRPVFHQARSFPGHSSDEGQSDQWQSAFEFDMESDDGEGEAEEMVRIVPVARVDSDTTLASPFLETPPLHTCADDDVDDSSDEEHESHLLDTLSYFDCKQFQPSSTVQRAVQLRLEQKCQLPQRVHRQSSDFGALDDVAALLAARDPSQPGPAKHREADASSQASDLRALQLLSSLRRTSIGNELPLAAARHEAQVDLAWQARQATGLITPRSAEEHTFQSKAVIRSISPAPRGSLTIDKLPYLDWRLSTVENERSSPTAVNSARTSTSSATRISSGSPTRPIRRKPVPILGSECGDEAEQPVPRRGSSRLSFSWNDKRRWSGIFDKPANTVHIVAPQHRVSPATLEAARKRKLSTAQGLSRGLKNLLRKGKTEATSASTLTPVRLLPPSRPHQHQQRQAPGARSFGVAI